MLRPMLRRLAGPCRTLPSSALLCRALPGSAGALPGRCRARPGSTSLCRSLPVSAGLCEALLD
eukprot:6857317-Alexandrium_andersonii.AAC.1